MRILKISYNNQASTSEVLVTLLLGLAAAFFALRYDSDPEHCYYSEWGYEAQQ